MTSDGLKKGRRSYQDILIESWRGSVIMEYLDCRRYAENGRVCIIDLVKPSKQDIKAALEKKVVIPDYTLAQNIRPGDLTVRTSLYNLGLPVATLEDANLLPEGLVNTTGFPGIVDDVKDHDPKLAFANRAVVRDDGYFYQWDIGKIDEYYRDKSDPLDSSEFFKIVKKLDEYQNSPGIRRPDRQLRADIEDDYRELEKAREKLRQRILDYHNIKKADYDTSKADVPAPPALSYFDAIKPTEDGYRVQTQMAPLFLRSAVRSLNMAEKAKESMDADPKDHDALADELEYSAMCIISAANCLEEYIDYVIDKHLPAGSEIFDDTSHKQKWFQVPAALGLPFRFKAGEEPYSGFSSLIKWRNNTIHHKVEYTKALDGVSHTYSQLNVKNARTAVRAVRDLVTKLSEGGTVPLPRWVKIHKVSKAYWDEVSDCLKRL